MVRRVKKEQPKPAELTPDRIKLGIVKLERRIKELEEFDISTIQKRFDAKTQALCAKINDTIAEIFGHDTIEYQNYDIYSLDTLPLIMGGGEDPLYKVHEGYKKGIEEAIIKLKSLKETLEEKFEDLDGNIMESKEVSTADDIKFLEELRHSIDSYLFLGHAPSIGTPGHDPDVDKIEEELKKSPELRELRKKITEAKSRAKEIISRFNINAYYVQYPPAAAPTIPIIKQHLLDIITENLTWRQFQKSSILDMIDETIGALKKGQIPKVYIELDDKLPILKSSFLDKKLQEIINETTKGELPISFIMIDIDHFKSFNDKYGHLIGDDVLKAISTLINKIVGNKGKVVRFGGEEISVVLPNYDAGEAKVLAERIRKAVEDYNFVIEQGKSAKITISIGVSTSQDYIEYKNLIGDADSALIISKEKGRNQINIYSKEAIT